MFINALGIVHDSEVYFYHVLGLIQPLPFLVLVLYFDWLLLAFSKIDSFYFHVSRMPHQEHMRMRVYMCVCVRVCSAH